MANVAQGGACLAVWFETKDTKIKAITLPSAFSAMLGITEAAIFGINFVCKTVYRGLNWRRGGRRLGCLRSCLHDRGGSDGYTRHGYRSANIVG